MQIAANPVVSSAPYVIPAGTDASSPATTADPSPPTIDQMMKSGDFAAMAQSLFNLPDKPGANGAISIDEITAGANNAAADLQTTLQTFFAQQNIPSTPPVQFKLNSDGQVVAYGSPSADQVNAALKNFPKVADQIQRTIGLQGNAEMMREGAEATSQYYSTYSSQGAAAADALMDRLAAWKPANATLTFGNGLLSTLYNNQTADQRIASLNQFLGVDVLA